MADNDDPDFEARSEEIDAYRTRINRHLGETSERDAEINEFLLKTKGDKSPGSWRAHRRFFGTLAELPKTVEKTKGTKEKKKSSMLDWL